ncbi:MAG TPA: GDSL-type esterase/lipase family protein [Stellaceae bacterium]|nr:GDSL-type esterase/lipase family protein [Stellaceae bacterium]
MRWLAALLLSLALPAAALAAAEPGECDVPADIVQSADIKLPHLAERLAAKKPVTMVALGGASTKGTAAGSPDLAYPKRLQEALAAAYPKVPITVLNEGVPRQTAQQMLERFPSAVMAREPVLVLWEAGVTDAVQGLEVAELANALQTGIDDLKQHAIDVILIDMQYSRSTAAVIDFDRYLSTVHRVGDVNGVYVFPRYAMMRYWSEQNVFNFDEVAKDERARLAAKVYQCLALKLADVIKVAAQ